MEVAIRSAITATQDSILCKRPQSLAVSSLRIPHAMMRKFLKPKWTKSPGNNNEGRRTKRLRLPKVVIRDTDLLKPSVDEVVKEPGDSPTPFHGYRLEPWTEHSRAQFN